jgi:hypothetical protein
MSAKLTVPPAARAIPGIAAQVPAAAAEASPILTKSRRVHIDSEFMSNPLWCGASADARYGRVRLLGAAWPRPAMHDTDQA